MPEERSSPVSRRRFLAECAALAGATTLEPSGSAQAVTGLFAQHGLSVQRGRQRDLLAKAVSSAKLKATLLPRAGFHPFPSIEDRAAWSGLRPQTQATLLARGEKYLHYQWPPMPATAFLEYSRTGNRTGYESLRAARMAALQALVFAECVEGKGRFLDDVSNGLWATCEESFWGVPAHLFLQTSQTSLPDPRDPVVDLFAAQTSALLASAVYLLETRLDSVSPIIRQRVYEETERRILEPLLARDFAWMGLPATGMTTGPVNNWDPWICWNWLTTSLLVDQDEDRRYRGVAKALRCLDVFINSYPDDGGCDEGPGYWSVATGAMYDALELLNAATGGSVDIFGDPLLTQMALYMNRVHIAGNYYINPGDASPRIQLDVDKVFRFGRRLQNQELVALAVASMPSNYTPATLPAIFSEAALRAQPTVPAPLLRDVWMPDTRIMAAREKAGSPEGFYLACIAANNGKSHSHNDTGSFWVYANGLPVLIDMGQQTYQKSTFGPHRYDTQSMQSAYHNLPTISGVQQGVGPVFRATEVVYESHDDAARLDMELAAAYPPQGMLKSWRRSVVLDRVAHRIQIDDRYVLTQPAGEILLSLMTPCRVTQDGSGRLVLISLQGAPPTAVQFDDRILAVSVETIPLDDAELKQNWGSQIFRILLKSTAPPLQGRFTLTISRS